MRIDVEGDLGALVPCQILHRFDVHARHQQIRNVSMPQDVGSDFKIDGIGIGTRICIMKESRRMLMKLYSRVEAAEMLGIGLTTLDKLRKSGKIGYYQAVPGGKVQFTDAQLEAYLERAERRPRRILISKSVK